MKVLILSITAGQGHNSTSKALASEFEDKGIECEILDTYKYLNPLIGKTVDKGYDFTVVVTPAFFKQGYTMAEHRDKDSIMNIPYLISSTYAEKLLEHIQMSKADVVICPHVWTAMMLSYLKGHKMTDIPTIGILTDFTVHPYWESTPFIDYLVTPHELLNNQLKKRGVTSPQILPFGIPINKKFKTHIDKKQARKLLGIDEDKFTILLMGGGTGYGDLPQLLNEIDTLSIDFQTLVVCGKNEKKYKKLQKHKDELSKTAYIYGFVNNVDVMMDAADCIISKPGGLSTSEALTKNLPMIIINPIPGHEERNTEFLLNNKAAMRVTKTFPVDECIYELFKSSTNIELTKKNMQSLAKPHSTEDLVNFTIDILNKKAKSSLPY